MSETIIWVYWKCVNKRGLAVKYTLDSEEADEWGRKNKLGNVERKTVEVAANIDFEKYFR